VEKKQRGNYIEDIKSNWPLWADLRAESHDIISDKSLLCSEDLTESVIETCADRAAIVPEIKIDLAHDLLCQRRLSHNLSTLELDKALRLHDKNKSSKLKIGMVVMVLMGISIWSWILVRSNREKSPIPRVMQTQMVGQTLMENVPVLLPIKIVPKKVVPPIDHHKKLGETILHIALGKQALKERHISKAIDNFMKAKQILNRLPHAKSDFFHRELNALHANALYWQGFLALQKDDKCQAKSYFIEAKTMAPYDKKIQDRLKEISSSLGC
jgi:hypothetical protein